MLFAVLFSDDPARADVRQKLMPDHLAFLEAHGSAISSAGPLTDMFDGSAAGGLWLVEAASAEEVRALCERDPFWPTGLRADVRVLSWRRVFADGRRLI